MTRSTLISAFAALAALLAIAFALSTRAEQEREQSPLPLNEFMGHVMQRNAEQLWAWTELVTDKQGSRWIRPNSDEEWEQAESDALTLQQLTYALDRLEERTDDPRWDENALALRAAATRSAAAAEAKNFDALVKAGEEINARCVACHMTFAPQLETKPPAVPLN